MKPEKTGAAKHSADYRDRKKAEADRLGIEKMHFDMPVGIRKQLAAELAAHGYSQMQELWQDLALSWIARRQMSERADFRSLTRQLFAYHQDWRDSSTKPAWRS